MFPEKFGYVLAEGLQTLSYTKLFSSFHLKANENKGLT